MKTKTELLVESIMKEASEDTLTKTMKEWKAVSDEIEKHRVAFEAMVADKLTKQAALKQTIEKTMDELKIKTHKVDGLIASIKAAYSKSYDASPKELWAAALTKVNAATKEVLLNLQESMKKTTDVEKSFNLKREGFMDTMSNIGEKIKVLFRDLYYSIKGMDEPIAELEQAVAKV